jgi:hypothetical protein
VDPNTRTGVYWIVWEERRGRWRLRAISRAAAGATFLLALLAATAGVLIALTQAGRPWVGWAWGAWVLAVAVVGARTVTALGPGLIRRSAPFRGFDAARERPEEHW